jgi:tetratricopeptide (TPR) repeat protein
MKKKLLKLFAGFLFVILVVFIISNSYRYPFQTATFEKRIDENDTIQARKQIELAKKIRGSDPDSAINCFSKAIDLLEPYRNNEKTGLVLASCYIDLAALNCENGDYQLSEKYDSLAMDMAHALKSKQIMALSLNIKGLMFFNQGEYPSALEYYEKAVSLAREAGDKKLIAKLYTNFAIIYYYQGNPDRAIEYFSKTLTTAREINNDELLAASYINMGLIAANAGKIGIADSSYKNAIEIYTRRRENNNILICYQNLGSLWFNNGNVTEAIDAYRKSLQMAIKVNDRANTGKGYHNMGEVYAYWGDYEAAIDQYIQSIRIKEQLNDLKGMAATYTSIGMLHYQRDNVRLALEYYQKSLEINQQLNYQQGMVKNYFSLSKIYRQTGQWDKGLEFAFKSLELRQKLQYDVGMDELYSLLGLLYSGKSDYQNAGKYLEMALNKSKETGNKDGIATSLYELADLQLQMAGKSGNTEKKGFYLKAVEYGNTALNLSREQKVLSVQLEACRVLKEAWQKIGDFEKALKFSEQSRIISDSLLNSEKEKALTLAEAKWNAESRQRKIDELEHEQELKNGIIKQKEEESRLKNTIIYLLVTIVALSSVVAFFIILRIRRRKDRLYEKQLACMTMLRMQNIRNRMSPHFFFNVLNTVSESAGNPEIFRKNMENLSLLLRKSIENIEQTAIPIQEELNVVKAFIDLQSQRVPGAFHVEFVVHEGVDMQRLIPAMMVQIPVENAIKHGLMPLEGEKELIISVAETTDDLLITIKDNGVGLDASTGRSKGTGTGLKVLVQTCTLLNQRNKKKIEFNINGNTNVAGPGGGTTVCISVPVNFSYD